MVIWRQLPRLCTRAARARASPVMYVGPLSGRVKQLAARHRPLCSTHQPGAGEDLPRHRVALFGTDEFAVPSLSALAAARPGTVSELTVFCPPNTGMQHGRRRALPVRAVAAELGLEVETCPDPDTGWDEWCTRYSGRFDVGVAVSFGHLIPAAVLAEFPRGTMNVHPSMLPRYRGAAPIQHALLNGDRTTAITIMELSQGRFDHGDILLQQSAEVLPGEGFEQLRDRLAGIGAQMLVAALKDLGDLRKSAAKQSQAGAAASPAPKISRGMASVDWSRWNCSELYRRHRAIGYQHPLRARWPGKAEVHIVSLVPEAEPTPPELAQDGAAAPGTAVFLKRHGAIYAKCADGWVGIKELRIPTKKPLSAQAFANGHQLGRGRRGGFEVA